MQHGAVAATETAGAPRASAVVSGEAQRSAVAAHASEAASPESSVPPSEAVAVKETADTTRESAGVNEEAEQSALAAASCEAALPKRTIPPGEAVDAEAVTASATVETSDEAGKTETVASSQWPAAGAGVSLPGRTVFTCIGRRERGNRVERASRAE